MDTCMYRGLMWRNAKMLVKPGHGSQKGDIVTQGLQHSEHWRQGATKGMGSWSMLLPIGGRNSRDFLFC